MPSASMMRRTFSTVTISPREGRTGMPFFSRYFVMLAFAVATAGACRARRKNSERILPAVLLSLAASSFAAESTSSSMSRVVLTMRDAVASDAAQQVQYPGADDGVSRLAEAVNPAHFSNAAQRAAAAAISLCGSSCHSHLGRHRLARKPRCKPHPPELRVNHSMAGIPRTNPGGVPRE